MEGAWSCCLPCAGCNGGKGGVAVSGTTTSEVKSDFLHQQPHEHQKSQQHEQQQRNTYLERQQQITKRICTAQIKELSNLDKDLDDDDDLDDKEECELCKNSTQLHDIKEEDDEESPRL